MTEHTGLSLDHSWDLYVDESTGDLAIDNEVDEAKKDLALTVGRWLDSRSIVGGTMNDGTVADIELGIRKLVLSDPRIESIESMDIDADPGSDELVINVKAVLGTFTRIIEKDVDDDDAIEEVEIEVAFRNGEVVRTEVLGEV